MGGEGEGWGLPAGPSAAGWRRASGSSVEIVEVAFLAAVLVSATISLFAVLDLNAEPGIRLALAAGLGLGHGLLVWTGWYPPAALLVRPDVLAVLRVVLSIAIVWLLVLAHRDYQVLRAWALAIAAGIETFVTSTSRGEQRTPEGLLRTVETSSLHVGLVLGLGVAGFVLAGPPSPWRAAQAWLGFQALILIGVLAFHLAERLHARAEAIRVAERADARLAELERRSTWIHDHVISALQPIRQQALTSDEPSVAALGRDLDRAMVEFRAAQLDLAIATGPIRLADLLHAVVRSFGTSASIIVPGYEVSGVTIAGDAARTANQFLMVAAGNAVEAGARSLTITAEADLDAALLRLGVIDDADGFEESTVGPGGGLARLRALLGDDLEIRTGRNGTHLSAVVALGAGGGS